jgi:hypothetical protein
MWHGFSLRVTRVGVLKRTSRERVRVGGRFISTSPSRPQPSSTPTNLPACARGDSNPQALRHKILSLARIPIPPLARSSGKGAQYSRAPEDATGNFADEFAVVGTGWLLFAMVRGRPHKPLQTIANYGKPPPTRPPGASTASHTSRHPGKFHAFGKPRHCTGFTG